ncbi:MULTISPECIES: hypothetical protein [unclassified Leptolyngbya]|uniref:hypothetical protein n=1 Tax=unclassified Leptolyngbya TaxID=2650499 RepID=UPI0016891193|nr:MULTISPECIES: hypothetical protein [unclassified Leptolyngbya]MBD1912897.1 hypothetical protein [Leptolyngbya sp. FACHB-8]MBD2154774.1 hypothetical protein [Leptolyngbya sp. FACHB-16]
MRSFALTRRQGLLISLLIPLIYGALSAIFWLNQPYVIQDDVRHHIVWMQRWADPELFPNDWSINYFHSVAPLGFKAVYRFAFLLGIAPLAFAKVLPTLLALVASFFIYRLTLRLFPVTVGAVLAVLLFNQQIWLNDDLVSASPRAFVYPIFGAFLDFLAAGAVWPCIGAIALQGLVFPQLAILAVAVLTVRLIKVSKRTLQLSSNRADYRLWALGLGVAIAVLIPFALDVNVSEYGPVITADQMRSMAEYYPGARNVYFEPLALRLLFKGSIGPGLPYFPTVVLLGFALPFLPKSRFPLTSRIQPQSRLLFDLVVASLGLFGLAHLLLLRLHFPNRYTYHTWRFVLSIAAAIFLVVLLERFLHGWNHRRIARSIRHNVQAGLVALGLATILFVPLYPPLLRVFQIWIVGKAPVLYEYLAQQPKDIQVASLALEANNIPAFAGRSLLVGRELTLPHHIRYYAEIQKRATAVIQGQYSPDPAALRQAIETYGIDYWLLDANAFDPGYFLQPSQDWLYHSSFNATVEAAIAQLKSKQLPAIVPYIPTCTVLQTPDLTLLDARCLLASTASVQQKNP